MLKQRGNRRRGGFTVVLVAGLLGLACTIALAQEPPKEVPPPTPAPAAEQSPATPPGAADDGTIAVNLNNVNIDSVVKFLSDMTGKMVIKHKDVKAQLSVFSPGKVTKERAFQLVSEALMLEKVAVVEDKDSIKLVPSESLSDMTVDITPADSTDVTSKR